MGVQSNSRFEAFDGSATPRATTLAFNQVGMGYFRTMTTKILDGGSSTARSTAATCAC